MWRIWAAVYKGLEKGPIIKMLVFAPLVTCYGAQTPELSLSAFFHDTAYLIIAKEIY